MNKKVLMVAFIYTPLGGSGVQRTLKFTKYLPEFGWQPYVVCCGDPNAFGDGLDPSLVTDIPADGHIWRRSFVNPLALRRWVQKLIGIKPRDTVDSQKTHTNTDLDKGKALRRLFQVITAPLAPFEFPPMDAALYWALTIIPGCLNLIRREKINLIYTSSFPYSDHVTGYLLKKLTGLPWVADFRDPWTQNVVARNTGWRYQLDQWVERRVLRTADKVLGVTPTYTYNLHCLAPRRDLADFITIENGYDSADYSLDDIEHEALLLMAEWGNRTTTEIVRLPSQTITLAHIGYLYDGTALPFLQALEALGSLAARFRVRFVGGLALQEHSWLQSHPPTAQIQVEPRKSHAEAIQAMQEADVLILFVIGGRSKSGHYPGKLFEYMASGTPVVLVGPEGDAADLLQRSGVGYFAPANDLAGLVKVLSLLAEQPQQFRLRYYQPKPDLIVAFERRALTEKLSLEFDSLVKIHR